MSKTTTIPNPFDFSSVSTANASESRKLDFTPVLINTSNAMATDLMQTVAKKPELHVLANRAIDGGEPSDLIALIDAVYDDAAIQAKSTILDKCDAGQLSRLLESRRSDRSKAKTKGPRTSVLVCRTYISAMIAELIIRKYWKKPYTGQTGATDFDLGAIADDQEALSRKVKSLQSKKSRLTKLAAYDKVAKAELQEVVDEIARLNELRPTVRATTKVIVKDLDVDQLRSVLSGLDTSGMTDEEQAKLAELMTKLG